MQDKLQRLADSMKRPETPIPENELEGEPLGAGYTYFGQFIDHDLTEDRTTVPNAGAVEPNDIPNYRTPYLDLDGVYGDGPFSERHKHLYADHARLLMGSAEAGEPFDLPLIDEWPQLADRRNNENIIVRQIHAMFLKLHNRAVDELELHGMPKQKQFVEARRRVRWQYQWLVCHDFLKNLCQAGVYTTVVEYGNCQIDWSGHFSIPVEFSQAAFRFGHSMVRDKYLLGPDHSDVNLSQMFWMGRKGALPPALAVDWNRFFDRGHGSMWIDSGIVPGLYHLPPESIRLFVKDASDTMDSLPLRTLTRGKATRLATGQHACLALCPDDLMSDPEKAMQGGYDPWAPLRKEQLASRTPLWYYILLESEIKGKGRRLGPLGSRLVAEVIRGALEADAESFTSRLPKGWRPQPWLGNDGKVIEVNKLLDVARLVGLARKSI